MRTRRRWLGPSLVVAVVSCRGGPSGGATTGSTGTPGTTASTVAVDTGQTDGGDGALCPAVPPSGGYDACPGTCGDEGQCLNDGAEFGVCTRGCFLDCQCWAAPAGATAQARCSEAVLPGTPVCVLDCSQGQSCPRGMHCEEGLGICAFAYVEPGVETETETEGSGTGTGTGTTGTGSSSGVTEDDFGTLGGLGATGSGSAGSGSTGSGSTGSGSTGSGSTGSGSTGSGSTGGGSGTTGAT